MLAKLGKEFKPLRPIWLTAGPGGSSSLFGAEEDVLSDLRQDPERLPFTPIVCVSASEPVDRERRSGYTYLQGSADDEEDWAVFPDGNRLTPALFWQHQATFLAAAPDSYAALVQDVVARADHDAERSRPAADCHGGGGGRGRGGEGGGEEVGGGEMSPAYAWVRKVPGCRGAIAIGCWQAGHGPDCWKLFDAVINVTPQHCRGMPPAPDDQLHSYLQMPVAEGKRDVRGLEKLLPAALAFAAAQLALQRRILVLCDEGTDRSVAVAVGIYK